MIGLSSPVSGFWQTVMDNLVTAYPNRVENEKHSVRQEICGPAQIEPLQ
jgi:hypothetical protein